ncbi:MAG: ABC transporter ATP-binding protein [Opitutaceae bacterium]|nr:ABC transporter ATP-binding protein [Opitutaceae bacterium]
MSSDRSLLLQISSLSVNRGSIAILQEINWTIANGEHWVLLGPNGCGKTSLLKTLLGYLSPSGGSIELLGRRYGSDDWREVRLMLGIVSSALQASIPPAETALETVISGRYAQLDLWAPSTRRDRKLARNLLRLMGAGELAGRPWLYLSQGERQRILIARALMARPRILILDEPCAGLDPVARTGFLEIIDRLASQAKGPSLVLVTHHIEEITPSFTHALALKSGRIARSGEIRRIVTSRVLSEVFGAPMRVRRSGPRYRAEVAG